MQIDKIMEEEGFTDVEKSLVKSHLLENDEKVKAIIAIKTAKANNKQSEIMATLTKVLALIALTDVLLQVMYIPNATGLYKMLLILPLGVVFTLGMYKIDHDETMMDSKKTRKN